MMKFVLFFSLILLIGLSSCLKEKTLEPVVIPPGPCDDTVSFSAVIMPEIIETSCNTAGCHDQSSGAAGYIFLNHNQVSSNASIIFSVMNHENGVTPMPYGQTKISDTLIQKFDCWMQQGLLNN